MQQEFQDFIEKMNKTSSSNDKVETIRHSTKNVRKLLYYTYNPFLQYYVRPKSLNKRKDLYKNDETKFQTIFQLLDSLSKRVITGHQALTEVNTFTRQNPELEKFLMLVLDRNLKIRASTKLINKALPGLIPEFNVALANKLDENSIKKVNLEKDDWLVSRKLDGVRCLVYIDQNGKATSYARSGKIISTIPNVEAELSSLGVKDVIYDGELCIIDENGNEDFQSIMKELGRKDHIVQNCMLRIFDFIPYTIFKKGTSSTGTLSQRLLALKEVMSLKSDHKSISVLKQEKLKSFDDLEERKIKATESGWEGLMIRKDSVYNGKRSYDILKVKTFFDAEYVVNDVLFNKIRYIKDSQEVEEEMLSGVIIEHKDNCVRVGSGFTIDERKHYYSNPQEIIGKTITVQYFEESQNQNGEFSLRFPVVKVIHGESRTF